MPKITEEPLVRIQLRLFESDLAELRQIYSQTIGVNDAIRTIIRSFLTQAKAYEEDFGGAATPSFEES